MRLPGPSPTPPVEPRDLRLGRPPLWTLATCGPGARSEAPSQSGGTGCAGPGGARRSAGRASGHITGTVMARLSSREAGHENHGDDGHAMRLTPFQA